MTTAERIYEAARKLPEPLAAEVLDFIAFLDRRHAERPESRDLLNEGQDGPMRRIWDNNEDDVWNDH